MSALTVVKQISPSADLTATAVATVAPTVVKAKAKKQKKELAYKSIVQTRSQKLREAMEAYDSMLNKTGNFYLKHLREPQMTALDADEQAMGTFLHNLRTQPLNTELVQKAIKLMPWFQWDNSKSTWSFGSVAIGFVGGFVALTASVGLTLLVQMALRDPENVNRLVGWMKTSHFD